eukprot:SAG31_NODE_4199_length_3480_cov_4.559302_2_plen_104_part_00
MDTCTARPSAARAAAAAGRRAGLVQLVQLLVVMPPALAAALAGAAVLVAEATAPPPPPLVRVPGLGALRRVLVGSAAAPHRGGAAPQQPLSLFLVRFPWQRFP